MATMKKLAVLGLIMITAVACTVTTTNVPDPTVFSSPTLPTPLVTEIARVEPSATAVPPTVTPPPTATITPSPTPIPPTPEPTNTPTPAGFTAIPDNKANGETAVDFNINTIDGKTIALSELQGSFVLLLPTVPGCGECMINLNLLDIIYPDFRGQGVQVLLLDLYPENNPGYWEFLAGNFREPEYIWGVVDTNDFVIDYEITTLGTIMMIDPDGKVVYRSDNLIGRTAFRQLFEVATSS
jgi:hypothetical protein